MLLKDVQYDSTKQTVITSTTACHQKPFQSKYYNQLIRNLLILGPALHHSTCRGDGDIPDLKYCESNLKSHQCKIRSRAVAIRECILFPKAGKHFNALFYAISLFPG